MTKDAADVAMTVQPGCADAGCAAASPLAQPASFVSGGAAATMVFK